MSSSASQGAEPESEAMGNRTKWVAVALLAASALALLAEPFVPTIDEPSLSTNGKYGPTDALRARTLLREIGDKRVRESQ